MCPELIQLPGRGTFHLISFFQKKNKQNGLHKDQIYEMKNALQACFIKLIFFWSNIATIAIILKISFDPVLPSLRSFFWSRPANVVIILKISFDVALPSFDFVLPSLWSLRSVVQWRLLCLSMRKAASHLTSSRVEKKLRAIVKSHQVVIPDICQSPMTWPYLLVVNGNLI